MPTKAPISVIIFPPFLLYPHLCLTLSAQHRDQLQRSILTGAVSCISSLYGSSVRATAVNQLHSPAWSDAGSASPRKGTGAWRGACPVQPLQGL
jgi:hypothetical protein